MLSSAAPSSAGGLHEVRALQVCRSGGAFAADAVHSDVVYVPCQAGLTAVRVSRTGAAILWRSSGVSPGAPVVAGGKVWMITTTGLLEGINLATGIAVQHMQLALPETHFPWLIADGETMYAIDGRRVMDLTGL